MRRADWIIAFAYIAMCFALIGGCQQAQRQNPQEQGQEANRQDNTTVNNYGVLLWGGSMPNKVADRFWNRPSGGTPTADGSIQGDSQQEQGQRADASGRTDQAQEGQADVEIPLSP